MERSVIDSNAQIAPDAGVTSGVREHYRGQSDTVSVIARALLFGVPSFYAGRVIGNFGDNPVPKDRSGSFARFLSWGLGVSMGLMGAQAAARENAESREQFDRMQDKLESTEAQNVAMRAELNRQLVSETKPSTQVSAGTAMTDSLQSPKAPEISA